MNKIKTITIFAVNISSFFCQLSSLAEHGTRNNMENFLVLDITTATNAVQNINTLWPEHCDE
jgi:hypothetical protein